MLPVVFRVESLPDTLAEVLFEESFVAMVVDLRRPMIGLLGFGC